MEHNVMYEPTIREVFPLLSILDLATFSCLSHESRLLVNNWIDKFLPRYGAPDALSQFNLNEIQEDDRNKKVNKLVKTHKLKSHQIHLLGGLLGVGGTSKVFKLAKLSKLAIKIPFGTHIMGEGDCSCSSIFAHHSKCKRSDFDKRPAALLEVLYNWASATSVIVGRLCREHLNGLLLEEYEQLRTLNNHHVGRLLFPSVYSFHLDNSLSICYYTMDRLRGETLRSVIKRTTLHGTSDQKRTIDFLPLFINTFELLSDLSRDNLYHCDLKPENIIVNLEEEKPTFQLIDPLPRKSTGKYFKHNRMFISFLTVAYNPKGYATAIADSFGLSVIILELVTNENPFRSYQRKEWGDEEEREHPLDKTLAEMMKKYKDNEFVSWILSWMVHLTTRPRQPDVYSGMLAKLKYFAEHNVNIVRFYNTTCT